MAISKWQLAIAASATCAVFVAPFAEASTYVVQSGDSLYKIAKKHNITVKDLKAWNSLSSSRLHVNQSLIVSRDEIATIDAPSTGLASLNLGNSNSTTITPTSSGSKIKTYRVVKGDTLSKIASRQSTTVAKLKEWNNLSSDLIKIGQVLIVKKDSSISSNSINSSTHTNGSAGLNNGDTTGQAPDENSSISEQQAISAPNSVDAMIKAQLAKEKIITKSPSATNVAKYNKVIEVAKSLIGVPYVFGGNSPSGFDCSGFISYVYNEAGIQNTRRSALDYFLKDTTVVKSPVPGDLVFFKNTYIATVSHIGIYLGNGEMIHAGSKGIEVTKLSYQYWSDRQVAFKRFNTVK